MPRFTLYSNRSNEEMSCSKLYTKLHTVFHEANIPGCDRTVVGCVQMDTTSSNKCLTNFCDESFVELTCDPRYVPQILKMMHNLGVYPDLEIDKLDALFVASEAIKTNYWEAILRERLYQKSFTARNAKVFLVDNLILFFNQNPSLSEHKEKFLSAAHKAMDSGNILRIKDILRMDLTEPEAIIWNNFLSAMKNDIYHLAILAGIS